MTNVIKLSSPATHEFWEIPILFEDGQLLALNKPPLMLASPNRSAPQQPSLIGLLHQGIERGVAWAKERGLRYLMNAHRLDAEASGVLLFAKSRPVLVALADLFGSDRVTLTCVALVQGLLPRESAVVEVKLAPGLAGLMHPDPRLGKRSRTEIRIRERFAGYTLLECRPVTHRPHQIRAHLRHIGLPLAGDIAYGAGPLLLSQLKAKYRLKPNRTERPLLSHPALHVEGLVLAHPITGAEVKVAAPWSKDLSVAVRYLRRYAVVGE